MTSTDLCPFKGSVKQNSKRRSKSEIFCERISTSGGKAARAIMKKVEDYCCSMSVETAF